MILPASINSAPAAASRSACGEIDKASFESPISVWMHFDCLASSSETAAADFKEGELIYTAALVPEMKRCKMQRVVVKTVLQNQGIGSKMLVFCEAYANENGFKLMYCHA